MEAPTDAGVKIEVRALWNLNEDARRRKWGNPRLVFEVMKCGSIFHALTDSSFSPFVLQAYRPITCFGSRIVLSFDRKRLAQTCTNGHKAVVREITNHLRRRELSLEQSGFGKLDFEKSELEVPEPRNPNAVKLGLQLPKTAYVNIHTANGQRTKTQKTRTQKTRTQKTRRKKTKRKGMKRKPN
jgi:hypothetical protein